MIEAGEKNTLVAHTASIVDALTYTHRGILLDTSRNFYPVKDILRTITAQSYNKMNVLHWHVTDSQYWPLYMKSHPELSEKGAYSTKEVYPEKDFQTFIKHAEGLGIRVIVEIDMPAHTASFAESRLDALICTDVFRAPCAAEPPAGRLNPVKESTKKLVREIVKEATEVFSDSVYHTGGDEINIPCWELHPDITDYSKKNNMTTLEIWFELTNNLLKYVTEELKKRPMLWEDPIRDGGSYPTNAIIQTWLSPPSTYTALGYDVVVSNFDYFYLDCGHGGKFFLYTLLFFLTELFIFLGWVGLDDRYISPAQVETSEDVFNYAGTGVSWCGSFKSWQRIYSYDFTKDISKDHKGKVLGGELAMWAEQTGPTVIDSRLWPRSSAAAGLYWSGSYDRDGERRTVKQPSERFYDWVYR